MKEDQSFEKISTSINELEKKALHLKENGEISKIDMDLLLQRVRELYDQLLMFDQQHFSSEHTSPSMDSETAQFRAQSKTKQANDLQEKEKSTEPEKEQEEKTTPEHLEQKDYSEEETAEPPTETKKSKEPQTIDSKEAKPVKETKAAKNSQEVVADKYQNKKTYRHDNLAQQQSKNDLSSMMQSKPITDLTKAIGVNDKFLFIRELFDGNRDHYHEAIQLLNEIPTFGEAQTYLHETFDWNWEDPVTKKFIELIKRKFAENQD